MKALFIGGTGIISSASSPLAVKQGFELTLLNRGKSARPTPEGVEVIHGDINNLEETKKLLGDRKWDVVVNWINFVPSQIERDIELFRGKTKELETGSNVARSTPENLVTPALRKPWSKAFDQLS